MTGSNRLQVSIADGIARIVMTGADRRNAIDLDWCLAFVDAVDRCLDDGSARVVLLEAQGDFFSVGGDIDDFVANRAHLKAHVLKMATLFHDGILKLHHGPLPTIAAVRGIAAGGGFSLALSTDMILASRSARFTSAYSASGLSPDGGLSYFLPRAVGIRRAFEIMALNPALDAEAALGLGIVARVYEDAAFPTEVDSVVRSLASMSPAALAALKTLLAASPSASAQQQLAMEAEQVSTLAATPQTMALLDAFIAKRRSR